MNQERDLPLQVFKPHVQMYAIVDTGSGDYHLLGHGFLSIITDEVENETVYYLQVESVKDSELLLRSRLKLSNNFEKQRGSVIVWNDCTQKSYYDLALSFQGDKECDIFWRLICEKIGKNYLQINGRQSLDLPSETNLPYILDKTKTAKDMVEYYLLNCPSFAASLGSVFKKFKARGDKMGMGMVGRIIKSIFSNVDYRMVQALFKDPTFELLLQVQKFLQDVDFPQWWTQTVKIKSIVPLDEEITEKIHIIHRLSFYRQNILDFIKEGYLQHILVMTQIEFSKEIISHLTKGPTLDELVKMTYVSQENLKKDIAEEETSLAENEQIRKQQFLQKKLEFLLEAIIISKQMQCEKTQERFFDKIFRSGIMEMATEYLDRGILRALDLFNCLAQLTPSKFIEYLKVKYRESPSDNLHIKLSKKYSLGSDQMQSSILQIIKNISQSFKNKENLDFFMGTFFASVFACCKEAKAILNVVSDVQNVLQNDETFFSHAIKNRVFDKLVMFLRNQRQQKTSQLRAIKILKRVLLDNADSSWSFKKVFLHQLNEEIIKSGFFDYCMTVLQKNIRLNNIISSSMLENLKIIREMQRFTPFHKEIKNSYQHSQILKKYIQPILEMKEEQENLGQSQPFSFERAHQIQQQKEEAYFLSEVPQANSLTMPEQLTPATKQEKEEELQSLRKLRMEISQLQRQKEDEEVEALALPAKKIKENTEMEIKIEFDLPFDEYMEGDK